MGLRFRKSIKLAPGVKLNLGKKSAGISVGGKYGGVSYNTKTGSQARVSAPGTGLSYSTKIGGSNKTKSTQASSGNNNDGCLITFLKMIGIIMLTYFLIPFAWIVGMIWLIFFRKKLDEEPQKQKTYTVIVAVLSALSFIFGLVALGSSAAEPTPSGNTESAINSEVDTEQEEFSSEIISTIDTETQVQESTEITSSEIETESQDISNTPEPQPEPEPEPAPVPIPVPNPQPEPEPESQPEPEPQPESEKEQTSTSTEKYAVNGKNGKIHITGECPATKTGDQAMTDAIYFDTYEEALEYSNRIAPDLKKRDCGNCW
jgi:cytoskeletal protein RodZ